MASKTNEQVVTETFSERSAFADGMTAAGASAGAGLLVSAIQNSVQTHNKGALGVFTRTGSTIALFSEYPSEHRQAMVQSPLSSIAPTLAS